MTNPTPHQPTAKDLLLKMYDLMNGHAGGQLGEIIADDAVTDWPQSGERVHGWRPFVEIMESYPGGPTFPMAAEPVFPERDEGGYLLTPMFTVVRTESMGETATGTVKSRYPDGSDWYIITVARAKGGKLVHMTQYFAPLYDAPEWRAQWVEHIDRGQQGH